MAVREAEAGAKITARAAFSELSLFSAFGTPVRFFLPLSDRVV